MHSNLLESDDIDANLYPALLQVFVLIIIGYLAGSFHILNQHQSLGLNKFVGTFALPALLLRNLVVLDFSSVNWIFLASIFISKTIVFLAAIFITLITIRPVNIGLAAVFAIFVSQSNDFALGFPIVNAVYGNSHPDYIHYIYLLAPISLVILNPIAFVLLEINEKLSENKINKVKDHDSDDDEDDGVNQSDIDTSSSLIARNASSVNLTQDGIKNETDLENNQSNDSLEVKKSEQIKTKKLVKSIIWSTISNPIVFMVVIGICANFILGQKMPALIDPIIATLADSFSAIALFYLGFSMVGKIKNLSFSSIVIILILIFAKGLLFPLITREIVLHLDGSRAFPPNATSEQIAVLKNETDSLSTFGFLYGTFPTAPALFIYITKYTAVEKDLISAALVFGTLASAPLMMISGKMISMVQNSNNSVTNFDDIQCKTAFGFSILTWFCCIWVLYIFLASGRLLKKPHVYTFILIIVQMGTSLIHIVYSSVTNNTESSDQIANTSYAFFTLFFAFMTRCLPVTMMLSLTTITEMNQYNESKFNRILIQLAGKDLFILFLGIGFPLLCTILCLIVPGMPEKQGMMVEIGRPQQVIAVCLILIYIVVVGYLLIIFARTKSSKNKNHSNYEQIQEYSDEKSNNNEDDDDDDMQVNSSLINRRIENGVLKSEKTIDETDVLVIKDSSEHFQIMNHVSLIVILTFNSFLVNF